MRLTRHSDYALRVLIYLAVVPEGPDLPSRAQIAAAFGISEDHVAKITAELAKLDYIETRRGRSGGLQLNEEPDEIRIGRVVEELEPHLDLTECMSDSANCPISSMCGLQLVFTHARTEFLETLHQFTLADVLGREDSLRSALDVEPPEAAE